MNLLPPKYVFLFLRLRPRAGRGRVLTVHVLLLTTQDEPATECQAGFLESRLFLQSVPNDSFSFDEEDILKVFLIAFIERDKKKQL